MKLPIPSLPGRKEKPEYLLALLLRQEKACAVIISQEKSGSTIVGKHEEYFQTNLEDASEEEWLKILDSTISKAEITLPEGVQTQKTIFGVPASWVEEKHIKKEYLIKLKKMSSELQLTPIGFLEIPEAIAHLLQEEEGAPTSALLVEIGKEYLSISLLRGGRVIETKFGALVDSPAKSADALLRTFENIEVFPSRVILFNGGYDEKLAQAFISHQWSRSLPFLHVPQISLLPEGFDAKAIVFGAATQMGFDITKALTISHSEIKTFPTTPLTETSEELDSPEPTNVTLPNTETPPDTSTLAHTDLSAFGFVKEKDIAAIHEAPQETAKETTEAITTSLESEMRENPSDEHVQKGFTVHSPYTEESNLRIPDDPQPFPIQSEQEENTTISTAPLMEKLMRMPQTLLSLIAVPSLPRGRKPMLILPLLLLICIGLIGAYVMFAKATITVNISPKAVDQNEDVTFATGGNDFAKNTIEAKTTSISLSGSTSVPATGKKETGTKAKGTVTLFNSADLKKQVQEGTTITTSNNLEFTLDKDVTIASATGDIFTGIKSGTAQVAVTAKQIGTEYNIPSNIKFSVGDNSSLAGKNEGAFSGGSKKNITVVSQADMDKATDALPKSLESKARTQLETKLTDDETLLTILPNFKPSKKDFSEAVGDEAKTLTLSSSVTFEGISYNNEDLLSFTKALIKEKFDPKLTVANRDIENTLKSIKQKDETSVTAILAMRARLLPKIDQQALKKKLAGKSFETARDTLTEYPQVENVEITLFPPLPLLPQILPRQSQNITIEIKTDE